MPLHPARVSILCFQFLPEYSCDPAAQCIPENGRAAIWYAIGILSECCGTLGACCSGRRAGRPTFKVRPPRDYAESADSHERRDVFMSL